MADVSATETLTRSRLLARNVALNLAGYVLPSLAALIGLPLLVRGLGDARFGILSLAWVTLGYFSLFDLGIGRAVTHGVADRLGSGREDEITTVIWTSLATLVPLGLVGMVALYLLAPWLTGAFLEVPPELRAEALTSFRLLAVVIPIAGVTSALRGVLEAKQRFGILNALRVPAGMLQFLGPVAVLPFSRSLVPALAILVATRLLTLIAHAIACERAVPRFWRMPAGVGLRAVRPLVKFGGWMTVSNVVSPLMATLDRYVVGAALGVGVVTYYAAPQELATRMWMFSGAILPVFFPAFATSVAQNPQRTAALFDRVLRITFAVLFLPTLLLVLLSGDILRIWLGPAFESQSTVVLQILAIGVLANTMGGSAVTLIQGLGRPDITGKFHLLELPVYAAILAFALPRWGITGVALVWSVRAIGDAVLMVLSCSTLLPQGRDAARRNVAWLALAIPALVAAMFIPSPAARVTLAALAIPLWIGAAWRWMLASEERGLFAGLTGKLRNPAVSPSTKT